MNLYGYTSGNPVNAVDPSGFCRRRDGLQRFSDFVCGFGDAGSLGLTSKIRDRLGTNSVVDRSSGLYRLGQVGGAVALTIATSGIGSEGAVAEGAGEGIARVAINRANGLAFEDAALSARGIAANGEMVAGRTLTGSMRNTMLDSMEGGLTEVKSGAYQAFTKQLQAQIDYARAIGQNYELIVNTSTRVSGPLQTAIGQMGGTIMRFDRASGAFLPY